MRHLVFRGGSSDFYDQRAGGWPVNGRPVTAQLSVPLAFSFSLFAFDPSFIPSLFFSLSFLLFSSPTSFLRMTAHESVRKCRSDGINFDEFPNTEKMWTYRRCTKLE